MKVFIILAIVCYFVNSSESSPFKYGIDDGLQAAIVMFRHGDRTEKQSYPKDPYFDKAHWPEGFGTFLNKGKIRHYNLGLWFRDRYSSFLSPTYKKTEIKVRSADADTCLMSAQCNLAALYKLKDSDEWFGGLTWDPVPVHTMPEEEDMVVALEAPCAKYDKLYNEVKTDEYFVNLAKENAEMFKFLSEKTGWDIQDIDYIRGLYSIIYITNEYRKELLPDWLKGINATKFTELAGLSWARETWTPELKRLRTGQFFEGIFSYLDSVIDGKDVPKFQMMASSIKALTSVLNTMEVFDNHPIEFAGTIIWELYKGSQNEHILKMFYKKYYAPELEPLKLKGCPDYACDYTKVKTILSNYILTKEDWEKECKL